MFVTVGPELLLDGLSEKFEKDEFIGTRGLGTKPYRSEFVAWKNPLGILKRRMTCFAMVTMGLASKEKVLDFSNRATRYAMDNVTAFLPTKSGDSFLVVPVAVSDAIEIDLKGRISSATFKKHWGTFEFPVIMGVRERTVYYSQRTPPWGAAMYKGFRKCRGAAELLDEGR